MIARIPLDRIFDNPFQIRTVYTGIEELADSIVKMKDNRPETSGLMQVPSARIILGKGRGNWLVLNPEEYGGVESTLGDEPDAIVQLAFGHRRHRAFHHLNNQGQADYATFPVEIVPLGDRAMSDLAWEENAKRKDLSPIEEAVAIRQAMDVFGYTQKEVGERWNLSQPAVANKLRLLRLPDEAQDALRSGQLSEKAGRALLMALAKGEAIYKAAAVQILPVPVNEGKADEARKLLDSVVNISENPTLNGDRPDDLACEVCGLFIHPLDPVHFGYCWENGGQKKFYICLPCYRAGSDWTSPTGFEAEQIVGRITRIEQQHLDRADFPLDAEINAPHVIHLTCEGCPIRDDDLCYNKTCYQAKIATWREQLFQEVRNRFQQDYGIDPEKIKIISDWQGHNLDVHSVDPEMVRPGGICAPGQCDRLRLNYVSYVSPSNIRPYEDLPFIFNCNHSGAHNAAQRRYLKANESEDEKSEAVKAAEEKRIKKAEARAAIDNAAASLAAALANQQDHAWRVLVDELNLEPKPEDTYEDCLLRLARKIFEYEYSAVKQDYGDPNYHIKKVRENLERWGISSLPDLEIIKGKLEKTYDFLYNARLEGVLTAEQVQGTRDNVQHLVDQIDELTRLNLIDDRQRAPLINQARELIDELWEGANEIGLDLPQDWGISLEISIAGLVHKEKAS